MRVSTKSESECLTPPAGLNPLFICVQETWCVNGEPDSFYHIDGFSLFRRDRVDRTGGGVCVYVNTCQARTIERIELDNDIEAIWLKITVQNIQKTDNSRIHLSTTQ